MTNLHPTSNPAHRFTVIGGDGRMTHLTRRLAQAGYGVSVLGCGEECLPAEGGEGSIRLCHSLGKATESATAIILPMPASRDGIHVHCPRDPACKITLEELYRHLLQTPTLTLLGGKLPEDFLNRAKAEPAIADRVLDYYESEVLRLRNAYVTAEAAVMTAMELCDITLRSTSAAVLGYGRIGKYLARLLRALGAEVTVCARREESLFEAAAEGCHPLLMTPDAPMGGLAPLCRDHAVIFNTVPARVLDRDLLLGLERDTLLIDLASAPFGADDGDVRAAVTRRGLRYLRAPSLPGSYAPREAGYIIAECVLELLARQAEADREGGTL